MGEKINFLTNEYSFNETFTSKIFKTGQFVQRFENFLNVTTTHINNGSVHTPKLKRNIVLNEAQIIKYGQCLARVGDKNTTSQTQQT